MIKFYLFFFIFLIAPMTSLAGVTVVGTRFFIDDTTRSLNIKVINDNDSDYLVKTTVNSDSFIISPPLFILKKNASNLITIIPDEMFKGNMDKVYSLTIATIPRAEMNEVSNVVSLAIRSHFKIIYRHMLPTENDFNQIKLTRSSSGKWLLSNPTLFAYTIFLSKNKTQNPIISQILAPGQKIPVSKYCSLYVCSLWLTIFGDESEIIENLNLTSGLEAHYEVR